MSVEDKLLDLNNRLIRWMNGQPFPPGFDEWCELSEAPRDPALPKHDSFSSYVRERANGGWVAGAESFFASVAAPGTHWPFVGIDPPGDYAKHELRLRFPEEHSTSAMSRERTHAWRMQINGIFKLFECINARVGSCDLQPVGATPHVRLVNCVIGKLTIKAKNSNYPGEIILELDDSWIGTLVLGPGCLENLRVTRGGIAQIQCPSDGGNPFTGAVSFKNVCFPSSSRQTKLFQGAHAYRSLYAHLKKLDNTLMANLMRSHQLRAERADEGYRFAQFTNWIYDTFSNYGMSPGRPLLWLLGLFLLTVMYLYNCDYGTLAQPDEFYKGANAALLDQNGGRFYRSLLLPLHSIINPFGIVFDARKLIVPTTLLSTVLLAIQGLLSDMLLVMTALSIRRRFKAE